MPIGYTSELPCSAYAAALGSPHRRRSSPWDPSGLGKVQASRPGRRRRSDAGRTRRVRPVPRSVGRLPACFIQEGWQIYTTEFLDSYVVAVVAGVLRRFDDELLGHAGLATRARDEAKHTTAGRIYVPTRCPTGLERSACWPSGKALDFETVYRLSSKDRGFDPHVGQKLLFCHPDLLYERRPARGGGERAPMAIRTLPKLLRPLCIAELRDLAVLCD